MWESTAAPIKAALPISLGTSCFEFSTPLTTSHTSTPLPFKETNMHSLIYRQTQKRPLYFEDFNFSKKATYLKMNVLFREKLGSSLLVKAGGEHCLQSPVYNVIALERRNTCLCWGMERGQRTGSTPSHESTSSFILPLAWSSNSFTVCFLQKLSCHPNNQRNGIPTLITMKLAQHFILEQWWYRPGHVSVMFRSSKVIIENQHKTKSNLFKIPDSIWNWLWNRLNKR